MLLNECRDELGSPSPLATLSLISSLGHRELVQLCHLLGLKERVLSQHMQNIKVNGGDDSPKLFSFYTLVG